MCDVQSSCLFVKEVYIYDQDGWYDPRLVVGLASGISWKYARYQWRVYLSLFSSSVTCVLITGFLFIDVCTYHWFSLH